MKTLTFVLFFTCVFFMQLWAQNDSIASQLEEEQKAEKSVEQSVEQIAEQAPIDSTGTLQRIYYRIENGFVAKSGANKADGFAYKRPFNPNIYTHKIYFIQSETLLAEYEVYDKRFDNKTAEVVYPIKQGSYQEWYITGKKRVSCIYVDNKLDGQFSVFHTNGQLKRLEYWDHGKWLNGECFDESGQKIEYCSYQELPEFVGGLPALYNFIGKELQYPKYARKNGIQGKVYVKFIVEEDGSVTECEVVRGVESHLNDEALRIVKAMPKWKPGKLEGVESRVKFVLPIGFQLR